MVQTEWIPAFDGTTVFEPADDKGIVWNGKEYIKILPIPKNYGLITYDGTIITVS